jgi:hypothetical protein
MTDTNCWLSYKRRSKRAALCSIKFPSVFRNGWYWTSELRCWCDSLGIRYDSKDGGTLIEVEVTKSQVEAFIAFVYEEDPDYKNPSQMRIRPERASELAELGAAVAQHMDPEAIHGLRADEW